MAQLASPETPERVLDKIRYVSFDEIGEAHPGPAVNYVDKWWVVDPKRGALIYDGRAPLCNVHRWPAERLRDQLCPQLEVRRLALVSLPYSPSGRES